MPYTRCRECAFWLAGDDAHCINCGRVSADPARSPETGGGVWDALNRALRRPDDEYEYRLPNLFDLVNRLSEQRKDLRRRSEELARIRERLARLLPDPDAGRVVAALDGGATALRNLLARNGAEFWKVELIHLQNRLEPIAAEVHLLTADDCERTLRAVSAPAPPDGRFPDLAYSYDEDALRRSGLIDRGWSVRATGERWKQAWEASPECDLPEARDTLTRLNRFLLDCDEIGREVRARLTGLLTNEAARILRGISAVDAAAPAESVTARMNLFEARVDATRELSSTVSELEAQYEHLRAQQDQLQSRAVRHGD